MPRPALSASRSIAILDFLAAFPERDFTLSEIADGLQINRASCHAVLNALVSGGYLSRLQSRKTYVLGPALVAIGKAALVNQPLLALATRAAERLAEQLDVPVLITAPVGDEILAFEAIATHTGQMPRMQVGQRRPHIPPVGAIFLAWSSEPAREEWLTKSASPDGGMVLDSWRKDLTLIRQRGFQIMVYEPEPSNLASLIQDLAASLSTPASQDLVKDILSASNSGLLHPEALSPTTEYVVLQISAPIFGKSGAVSFSVSLSGFKGRLNGAQIGKLADRLMQTCLEISHAEMATSMRG